MELLPINSKELLTLNDILRNPSHGYLFLGEENGVALLSSYALASAMLRLPIKFENFTHPNLSVLLPEENKKHISIAQTKKVFNRLSKSGLDPNVPKILIIESAEKLGIEASNSLLKLLEEPPKNTVCILVASNQHTILPTITSRLRTVKFSKPKQSTVIEFIKKTTNFPEDKISNAVSQTNTRVVSSLRYLEDERSDSTYDICRQYINSDLSNRILLSKEICDSIGVQTFLDDMSYAIYTEPSILDNVLIASAILDAQRRLSCNVNQRLVLEQMSLEIDNAR